MIAEGQREVEQQLADEARVEAAAALPPVSTVEILRGLLAGTQASVTQPVPATTTGTPAALNDLAGLLRGAMAGGHTVNGQPG